MTAPARFGDRGLFPRLEATAYLNHAAIAPVCEPVERAIASVTSDYARHGVAAFPTWDQQRAALRANLGRLVGARPEEIALGTNTSRAISDVALSFPWRSRDRIGLLRGEFPANVTPWQRAAELFSLECVFLDVEGFETERGLEELEALLQTGVRVLSVSLVEFQTGLRLPIERIGELCRRYNTALCVDAIQACGVLPVDVERAGVDFLACGGHKWLLGVEGAAFLYVGRAWNDELRPFTAGWLSHEDGATFLWEGAGHLRYDRPLKRRAEVFEGGTSNAIGLAALGASVELLLTLGIAGVQEHVQRYHDALEPGLIALGCRSRRHPDPQYRSGILSVELPEERPIREVAAGLRDRGIVVGTPDGHLRFAPHFANSLDEVPRVLDALESVLRK